MKSTRRHELQTNVLADWLGRTIARAKPHGRTIGYGAIVVAALVFLLFVLPALRGTPTREAAASAAFLQAVGPRGGADLLRAFLDEYPEAPQALAARVALGHRLYMQAVRGTDGAGNPIAKDKAQRDLAAAKDQFEQAAADLSCVATARLMLALITVQEGRLEAGLKALQEVVDQWPQSEAAGSARLHLGRLQAYKPVAFSDEPLETPKKEDRPQE
jgi:hypothetical protein